MSPPDEGGAPTVPTDIPVLAETPDLLAVLKPAGLPVIPTREDPDGPTLQRVLEAARGERLYVVHRLDRDTSGVVLLARTAEAHRRLNDAFASRRARKTYLALCRRARPDAPTAGRIDLALVPGRKGGMRVAEDPARPGHLQDSERTRGPERTRSPERTRGGKRPQPAVTRFRVLAVTGDLAVLEAHPETGRTHQIRVHLAAVGWPLAVDPRYGDPGPLAIGAATCARLTLHARRLVLPDAGLDVTAPVPEDLAPLMAAVLQRPLD